MKSIKFSALLILLSTIYTSSYAAENPETIQP